MKGTYRLGKQTRAQFLPQGLTKGVLVTGMGPEIQKHQRQNLGS